MATVPMEDALLQPQNWPGVVAAELGVPAPPRPGQPGCLSHIKISHAVTEAASPITADACIGHSKPGPESVYV